MDDKNIKRLAAYRVRRAVVEGKAALDGNWAIDHVPGYECGLSNALVDNICAATPGMPAPRVPVPWQV